MNTPLTSAGTMPAPSEVQQGAAVASAAATASDAAPAPSLSADANQRTLSRNFLKWSLALLNVVAIIFMLKWADAFFIPLVAGIFLSYTLGPIVDWLQKRLRMPRAAGAAIAVLLFVAAVAGVGAAVWWQAVDLAESLPSTISRVTRSVKQEQGDASSTLNKINEAARAVDKALKDTSDKPATPSRNAPGNASSTATAPAPTAPAAGSVYGLLAQQALAVLGSLGTLGSVLLLAYFLLTAGDQFRRKTVRLAGKGLARKRVTVELLNDIHSSLQKYLATLVLTNTLLGLVTWLVLLAQGFRNAEVWGALAGILHFIPYLGPLLTAAGVLVTGMQQWGSPLQAGMAAGTTLVVASGIGMLVQTWVLGRIANINHTAQFVALLFFGWLWGALGLLIAIPMAVVIKVVSARVEELHPLAAFLRAEEEAAPT